jgi:hypothetical protein
VDRSILSEAWDHLRAFPKRPVALQQADGRSGFPADAPYDRLMVTAATPDLEPAWLEQLAAGGWLLAPLSVAPGLAYLVRGTVRQGTVHGNLTRAAYFMPLRGENEPESAEAEERAPPGQLQVLPAPWAGWFDRRQLRIPWYGFIQALAFYGLLRGLEVRQWAQSNNQIVFGLGEAGGAWCWLGPQDWRVTGPAGRDVGWHLWRAFLNAGGPWPTEFDLMATPGGGLTADEREAYLVQGPRCQQLWQLREPRVRGAWI